MSVETQLALLGGRPVRTGHFSSKPMVGEEEKLAVLQTFEDGVYSRFVGSNMPGTREALRQTSEELINLHVSHSFLGGMNVRKFEADWAKLHKVKYAVAMNSATSAITAGLLAMGIEPGDEVITTPLSFTATATAIVAALGVPVFADIDEDTLCLCPAAVEKAITPRTKFIVPVHWCGNAGTIDEIMKLAERYNLQVLEDSCQSPGTEYQGKYLGNHGVAGVFSYSEPKNVMTGEGGMLITDDVNVAEKCRLIRNHGEAVPNADDSPEFLKNIIGYNFRMTEMTAAVGWAQTAKLNSVNRIRYDNYTHLIEKLTELQIPELVPQKVTNVDSFYAYTAVFRWLNKGHISRDAVVSALRAEGIPVATGVGRLLSDNPLFAKKIAFGSKGWPLTEHEVSYDKSSLPVAHEIHDNQYLGFFLCGYPNTSSDMDNIVSAFRKIDKNRDELAQYISEGQLETLVFDRGRG